MDFLTVSFFLVGILVAIVGGVSDWKTTKGKAIIGLGILTAILALAKGVKDNADAEEQRKENKQLKQQVDFIADRMKVADPNSHVVKVIEQPDVRATLKRKYPFGYGVFGYEDRFFVWREPDAVAGGFKHTLKADWKNVRLAIDKQKGQALLTLPHLDWTVDKADGERIFTGTDFNVVDWPIPLRQGATVMYPIGVPGPADLVIEVLDPTPENPVFVLGLRKKSDAAPKN